LDSLGAKADVGGKNAVTRVLAKEVPGADIGGEHGLFDQALRLIPLAAFDTLNFFLLVELVVKVSAIFHHQRRVQSMAAARLGAGLELVEQLTELSGQRWFDIIERACIP